MLPVAGNSSALPAPFSVIGTPVERNLTVRRRELICNPFHFKGLAR